MLTIFVGYERKERLNMFVSLRLSMILVSVIATIRLHFRCKKF